ncbi:MAG TPA: hypothetical protein VMR31_14340 [Myxococcota bacterium]|nr:hypothetical protein [Myxococcota bacterium]
MTRFAAALALALVVGCATAPPEPAAPAGPKRREYIGFSFDEPSDPRWVFVAAEEGPSAVVLWRTLDNPAHTFYVRVALGLRDKALDTPEALLAEMGPKLEAIPASAKLVSASVSGLTRQGQLCLRIDRVSSRDPLVTTYHGFYCNHPSDPRLGIYLIYSQQGKAADIDPALDAEGEKFLAGVSIDVRPGVPAH